jgi:adenylate cyclase
MTGADSAILVVDDNEDNRYTLVRRLTREGYDNVTTAPSGREALELLARTPFDLVLLDIMMPEVNGYQVLEQIKSDTLLRDIPVVMISAVDELESVVRCIRMGAEDYLPKPFNPVLLKARVGASLEKKKLRDLERHYLNELEAERRRAEKLLHAILPMGAVRELKATNTVVPRRYDDVAVLFADIVDFTSYCDRHPPERVLSDLQRQVARLEEIVADHGMEKIKTVGDAFMATAGLLQMVEEPVLSAVRCGLAMVAASADMEPHWQLRVGIHDGPVVAGIVGQRQFLFDLWGDTVNTAARATAKASPNSVIVTGAAWMKIRDRCRGRSQGLVEIKGKGKLELIECAEVLPPSPGLAAL